MLNRRNVLLISSLLALPVCAVAQTTSSGETEGRGWIPGTTHGYLGISAGEADYDTSCVNGFNCDHKDAGFKLYTGGRVWNIIGVELSYINLGKTERGGGETKAQGVDLSAIANLPLGSHFSLFGKVGSTYGWTKVSAEAPGVATGKEHGFGLSYGAGLGWEFSRNWGLRAEWERHRFDFVGNDRDVDFYSLGVHYRF
jgi:OmpA-OmpF porin, OOP family